jgi:hypothetical protein
MAIGAGYHLPLDRFWLDVDATVRTRTHLFEEQRLRAYDVLVTPRAQLGFRLLGRFSAFAGLGLNIEANTSGLASGAHGPTSVIDTGPTEAGPSNVSIFPAFLAGFEI